MKIIDFIEDIKLNCSQIAYLCTYHICTKIYNDVENDCDEKENILKVLHNYNLTLKYLNDYAGVIYRQYNSTTQDVYNEICNYHNLDTDNEYTYAHIIKKLQKQTPELLMSLVDEDIKIQTINNFEQKINNIKNSFYYKSNKKDLEITIKKLENNISLVKRASQL